MKKKFQVPNKFYSDWDKVSEEYLLMVLHQASQLLQELTRAGEQITEKGFRILTIDLTLLGASILYLTRENQSIQCNDGSSIIMVIALCSIAISILSIGYLIGPLWFYNSFVVGSEPLRTLSADFLSIPKEQQRKNFIFSECIDYQNRIDYNNSKNTKRARAIGISTSILLIGLATGIVLGIITDILC